MRHLKWNVNPFGGAVVDPKSVPVEPDEFLEAIDRLENLMKSLSKDNKQRDPDKQF